MQERGWGIGALAISMILLIALVYQYQSQQQAIAQLSTNQQVLVKQLADLNDRLVALSRQAPRNARPTAASIDAFHQSSTLLMLTLRQSLIQAQTALDAGRIEDAQNLLQEIQRTLYSAQQQQLSAAIRDGLQVAIGNDLKQIAKSAAQIQHAQHQTHKSLAEIQDYLAETAYMGPQLRVSEQLTPPHDSPWWQIFVLERVNTDQQPNLTTRPLICHEVALTLGLARQVLQQQQVDQYRQLLLEADQKIQNIPDPAAQQVHQWLQQLLAQRMPRVVQLSALSLLSDERQ